MSKWREKAARRRRSGRAASRGAVYAISTLPSSTSWRKILGSSRENEGARAPTSTRHALTSTVTILFPRDIEQLTIYKATTRIAPYVAAYSSAAFRLKAAPSGMAQARRSDVTRLYPGVSSGKSWRAAENRRRRHRHYLSYAHRRKTTSMKHKLCATWHRARNEKACLMARGEGDAIVGSSATMTKKKTKKGMQISCLSRNHHSYRVVSTSCNACKKAREHQYITAARRRCLDMMQINCAPVSEKWRSVTSSPAHHNLLLSAQ